MDYKIKIHLKTETLFGNGEVIPGFLDADVQTDVLGMPFLKAKTLKGLLREQAGLIEFNRKENSAMVTRLFGDEHNNGILRISDAVFSPGVQTAIKAAIGDGKMTVKELKRSITMEYSYTRIENGVAADHSLRTIRMMKKDLIFYSAVSFTDEIDEKDLAWLTVSVALLKHIGTLKSKGKGVVTCSLLQDDWKVDVGHCIDFLCKTEVG